MPQVLKTDAIKVNTPLGRGNVLFVELLEDDNYWTVALDNCAIVTFPQSKVRICRSYTLGRGISDDEMRIIING